MSEGNPGGFNFNLYQQLQNSAGSSADPTQADTPDSVIQGGINRFAQTLGRVFGFNSDLENRSALRNIEVGNQLSLTHAKLFHGMETSGGVLASILKYFTRELPAGLADGVEGGVPGDFAHAGGGDFSGGGSGDFGGGAGGGGDYGGGEGGGPNATANLFSHHGNHIEAPETIVSYGDKLFVTDAFIGDLGRLSPPATGSGGVERDGGVELG